MKLYRRNTQENLIKGSVDLCVAAVAWLLSYSLRFVVEVVEVTKGHDTLERYAQLIPLLCICYLIGFATLGIYTSTLNRSRVWDENFRLAKAHVFSFLIFVACAYFFFDHRYSRFVLLFHFVITPILLPFGRSLARKTIRLKRRLSPPKPLEAVLMGEGPVSDRIAEMILQRKDWNLHLVARYQAADLQKMNELLERGEVDVAFVSTHNHSADWVESVFSNIGNTVTEIIYVPDFGTPTFLAPRTTQLQDLTAVVLNGSALQGYGPLLKRAFDIVFAALFVLVFSPLFVLCALLVRLSSPGPILYRQERMGLDGKTFECLKFRGMRVDAEAGTGPVWARKDDDRTTTVGKWLRRTSLDEIPQFFNVLRGEMSVVGPRPERPVFVSEFRSKIPGYMLRHSAKAGITGWAQINGWRGNTSLEKRIECDLWYLQNWSLLLDVKICLLTPLRGLVHPNAY